MISPKTNAAFVANMEDVLDVYEKPYDPSRPVVCADEAGKQLIGEVREPLPVRPGKSARYDSEYLRGGMVNLFMAFEPLAGVRQVQVTTPKTSIDSAHFMKQLADCTPRTYHVQPHSRVLLCATPERGFVDFNGLASALESTTNPPRNDGRVDKLGIESPG